MFSHKKFRILTSNDDNTVEDDDTDDYSTGATWYSLSLMIVGAAAFVGLIAYAVVCRRIQKRSNSEIFNAHVITAPDDPNPANRSRTNTNADFRQALMHDDDEARDILIRSAILFDGDKNKGNGSNGAGVQYQPPNIY